MTKYQGNGPLVLVSIKQEYWQSYRKGNTQLLQLHQL